MTKLYIFDIKTGKLLYIDIGRIDDLMRDLGDDKDFTLQPPPSQNAIYYKDGWYEQ